MKKTDYESKLDFSCSPNGDFLLILTAKNEEKLLFRIEAIDLFSSIFTNKITFNDLSIADKLSHADALLKNNLITRKEVSELETFTQNQLIEKEKAFVTDALRKYKHLVARRMPDRINVGNQVKLYCPAIWEKTEQDVFVVTDVIEDVVYASGLGVLVSPAIDASEKYVDAGHFLLIRQANDE